MQLVDKNVEFFHSEPSNPVGSFEARRIEFMANPSNRHIIEELEKATGRLDAWNELYTTALNVFPLTVGRRAQVFLQLKMGDWCLDKLSMAERALAHYNYAMKVDPGHYETYKRLTDLYEENAQWNDAIYVQGLALERCDIGPQTRKRIFYQIGQVYEVLLDTPKQALTCYQKALEIAPADLTLLESLDRCYSELEQWSLLLSVLKKKTASCQTVDQHFENYLRIGNLQEHQLHDADGAIDAYQAALGINPKHMETLCALERIYENQSRHRDVRDILEKQFESTTSAEKKLALAERLGTMFEEMPRERPKASMYWETVFEMEPSHSRAFESLKKLYTRQEEWVHLIRILEKQSTITPDSKDSALLYIEKGQVYLHKCLDFPSAIGAFSIAKTLLPGNTEALQGLAEAYEKTGSWEESLDCFEQLLSFTETPSKSADYCHKIGFVAFDKLDDSNRAIKYLLRAIDLNNSLRPAITDLVKVYLSLEAWSEAIDMLTAEMELADRDSSKSRIAAQIGNLHQKMNRRDSAYIWFKNSLSLHRFNPHAIECLSKMYLEDELYEQAEPLLDIQTRLDDGRPDDERQALFLSTSRVAKRLGKSDKHLNFAIEARRIGRANLDVILNLADALFHKERWDDALEEYKAAVLLYKSFDADDAIDKAVFPIAQIYTHQGELRQAKATLLKILESNPNHLRALMLLTEAYTKSGNLEKSVKYQWRIAELLEDPKGKFDEYQSIGDRCRNALADNDGAIRAYSKALEISPKNRPILKDLVAIYQEMEQWSTLLKVIEELAEIEDTPSRRSRIKYSMALVYRDKLGDPQKTLEYFNRALDEDPGDRAVFRALIKLLAKSRDWEKLADNYHKMIGRAAEAEDNELEANCWSGLGSLYMRKMKVHGLAEGAFQEALRLDPTSKTRRKKLALCYASHPESIEKAIEELRYLVKLYPDAPDYLRLLSDIFISQKRFDDTWTICGLLVSMEEANATEQAFYEMHKYSSIMPLKEPLGMPQWDRDLRHPDDCPLMGELFEIVQEAIREKSGVSLKLYGVRKRDRVSNNDDSVVFARLFHQAAQNLLLHREPDLYIVPNDFSVIQFTKLCPATSVFGENYLLNCSQMEMLFRIAQHLAYCRPGRAIQSLIPNKSHLKLTLLAAIKTGVPTFPLLDDTERALRPYMESIDSLLNEQQKTNLQDVVRRLLETDPSLKISKWLHGISYTACRTAFFLTGDVAMAAKLVEDDTVLLGSAAEPALLVNDLKVFCTSNEYRRLRDNLQATYRKTQPKNS